MISTSVESHIILALRDLENDPKLNVRKAAEIYNASRTTLRRRQAGTRSRAEITIKSQKLTDLEEETIIQRLLDLSS